MKKNPDYPAMKLVYIIISFLLALLDMTLLYEKMVDLMNMTNAFAMLTAFIIATIANFIALTWGMENGKNLAKRAINKQTFPMFAAWALIGVAYATIRAVFIFKHLEDPGFVDDIAGEIIQIFILAISYVGTGTLIESSAREINDADCVYYRGIKKKFDKVSQDVTDDIADIKESIGILKKYGNNFSSLDRQKNKIKSAICRAEKGVMSDIAGKLCSEHPEISPDKVEQVEQQVLEEYNRDITG